jgi:hypothetical protein
MGLRSLLREAWEMVPILLLLFAGSLIALRSGLDRSASRQGLRQFTGNLYRMLLRVMGYVAVLLALQYWIGQRPLMGW